MPRMGFPISIGIILIMGGLLVAGGSPAPKQGGDQFQRFKGTPIDQSKSYYNSVPVKNERGEVEMQAVISEKAKNQRGDTIQHDI